MTTESSLQDPDNAASPMVASLSQASVISVTSTAPDRAYRNEGFIVINVEFDQPVTVTGRPTLILETGVNDAEAFYSQGTGTNQLSFVFPILPNYLTPDLDYADTSALKLNGGTIKDLSGNDVSLTLPAPGSPGSLGANKAIVIDSTPPEVVSAIANGSKILLTFSETIVGNWFLLPDNWTVTVDGQPVFLEGMGRNLTQIEITLSQPIKTGQSVALSFSGLAHEDRYIKDNLGNPLGEFSIPSVQNDTSDITEPSVTSVVRHEGAPEYTRANAVTFQMTFSEPVTFPSVGDFEVTGTAGGTVTAIGGDGTTWFIRVSGVTEGMVGLRLKPSGSGITDLAGNPVKGEPAQSETYTVDNTAPSVASATIDGSTLVLTYSEQLDTSVSTGALIGGFIVMVDGQIVTTTERGFGPDGKSVVITLASPVTKGQAVSVIYEDPRLSDDEDAIQDLAGNDSAGFAHLPVTNATGGSGNPIITGVSIPNAPMALGDVVTVTITVEADSDSYSLAPGSYVGPYALTNLVKVNDTTYTARFTVTEITGPSLPGDDISVGVSLVDSASNPSNRYTQPIVQDNDRFDLIRPTLISASVTGAALSLAYSESLDPSNLPSAQSFSVHVNGKAVAVSRVLVDENDNTLVLQLVTPVTKGQSVSVSYIDPTTGNDLKAVQDKAGNDGASFTSVSVANRSSGSLVDGVEVVESRESLLNIAIVNSIKVSAIRPSRPDDTGSSSFADIPLRTSDGQLALHAQLAIGELLEAGIINGTNGGSFDPTGNISRRDFAIILAKAFGLDLSHVPANPTFSDMDPSTTDWGLKFVEAVQKAGLVPVVSGVHLSGRPELDTIITGQPTIGNLLVLKSSDDGIHRKVEVNNVGFLAVKGSLDVYGGTGSQFVVGDAASQRIVMGAEYDTIHGGGGDDYVGSLGGNDELYGDDGNDTVSGGDGNDRLDGGTGYDIMYGGAGNDTYYVDSMDDRVVEYRGEGIDTVRSSVSYILSNGNVENLVLSGTASSGYGNGLANKMQASDSGSMLYGWGGNDTLSGAGGRDRLYGSSGDDRLYGNGGNDRLYGGTGKDRLDAGQGNDYLAGESGNDVLKGGNGKDTINGGSGDDVIYGGRGADILYGGYGRDAFVFDTRLGRGEVDTIRNFNVKHDTIRLENAIFKNVGGKGALDRDAFYVGSHARDAEDRIIYNAAKGALYYDKDGVGGAAQVQFAKLDKHLLLTADDFKII